MDIQGDNKFQYWVIIPLIRIKKFHTKIGFYVTFCIQFVHCDKVISGDVEPVLTPNM